LQVKAQLNVTCGDVEKVLNQINVAIEAETLDELSETESPSPVGLVAMRSKPLVSELSWDFLWDEYKTFGWPSRPAL
jgi:hypothetical protein